jgi:DNA-binding NarL/FixJ family response regulator
MTISVIVADDDSVVRAGIVMLLRAHSDIDVVGEATDGSSALELASSRHCDVVLMDVRMPGVDGVTATRRLTEDPPAEPDHLTKVLILTTFDDDDVLYGALSAGASGFLLKRAAPDDLVAAVRRVAHGGAWIDAEVAPRILDALAALPQANGNPDALISRLTPREQEILTLIAAHGLSNGEIAHKLVLSEATVKTHVARVIMKTGSRDRAQAVTLAYQSGLVRPPRPASRRGHHS